MTDVAVRVTRDDDVAVATVVGEVDLSNVRGVQRNLLDAVAHEVVGLVVDLSDVRYVDSSGVSMLFDLARQLGDRRRGLAFVVPQPSPLSRLLDITDLTSLVTHCTTVPECVDALRTRGI